MTNRSCGVSKTRCNAIVSSTTPRFGPRCPPVCERTLISSSRTSCASWGKSCSRSALISPGERMPSRRRLAIGVASEICEDSEEFDFVICILGIIGSAPLRGRLWRWLEVFDYSLPCAVASDYFYLLLGLRKSFLANFHQVHSFFVTHDQVFERQFARLHLLDNFFEPIHRALKIELGLARLGFAAHGENGRIKHSLARRKGATYAVRRPTVD